jgi:hypothetical protein
MVVWTKLCSCLKRVIRAISWTYGRHFTFSSCYTWENWYLSNNHKNLTHCMHLVVYLLSSLRSTPICKFRHMSCGKFLSSLFSYIFTILYFMLLIVSVYIDRNFTFYRAYNSTVQYILPQHDLALLSHITMFFLIYILHCHNPCIYLFYDFIVFRLVSYHIDAEVAQKGK